MQTFKIDILDERAVDFLKHLHVQQQIKIVKIEDEQNSIMNFDPAFSIGAVKEIEALLSGIRSNIS